MAGLLDGDAPITEEGAATEIMQELGFETAPVPEPVDPQLLQGTSTPIEEPEDLEEESDPLSSEPELGDEFEEAERRMSKAILYRELIRGRFFGGDSDLITEVEAELKGFVKTQYLILSGANTAPVVAQPVEKDFNPDEITALKELANRILKTPKILEAPKAPKLQPKPVPKAVAPVPPPAPKKPPVAPPKKPQLQTRKVPEEVAVTKPVQKPVVKPAAKPQKPTGPAKLTVPEHNSVIEENNQRFRILHVEMSNIDEYGIMDGGKIRTMSNGSTCLLSNGIQVKKDGETVFKILRSALPNDSKIPGRLPTPSREQFAALSQLNAMEATNKYPSLDAVLGRKRQ
jgi:hypothetical protein